MRAVFLVFLLTMMALFALEPVKAQEVETHPQADLTLREVIEAIAEFNVIHTEQQPFSQPAFGVTAFDTPTPTIWIFNVGDRRSRESTLIHELLHIRCRKALVNCSDEYVGHEEERQLKAIFGE